MKHSTLSSFRRWAGLAGCALAFFAAGCSGGGDDAAARDAELTVFAAASLTDVLNELAPVFEKAHGARLVFNYAGSNTLAQQIVASPDAADVFISASERWMDHVAQAGAVADGTRRTVLSNSLAIVANNGSTYTLDDPAQLAGLDFKYLAVGDPDAVPAGRYAKAWLQSLPYEGGTLWNAVQAKVSPAPDVRAALGQVEGSEDVIGIVYQTDYAVANGRVRLLYTLPAADGPQIAYAAAALGEAPHPELARAFLDFLASAEAVAAFEAAGFTVVN